MSQGTLFADGPIRVPLASMRGLVESSKVPCQTCHCRSALNPHRVCRRKVHLLADLARYLRDGETWVRVEQGRGLQGVESKEWRSTAYCATAHVVRLGWFGLAEHRAPRVSEWKISTDGLRFLRGELEVPAKILCTAGDVIYQSNERVLLRDVRGTDLDKAYWDAYPWSDFIAAPTLLGGTDSN